MHNGLDERRPVSRGLNGPERALDQFDRHSVRAPGKGAPRSLLPWPQPRQCSPVRRIVESLSHAQPNPVADLSPSASPAPLDLKPVLRGLLDRNGVRHPTYLGSLAGYVVNVHWSQLQPTPDGALAADNPIDQAITEVRALNATDHAHLGLKIRIFAGVGRRTGSSRSAELP